MDCVAVEKLAKMGASVLILGRSPAKSRAVVDDINQMTESTRAQYVHCDLAKQASIRTCAREVLRNSEALDDVLVEEVWNISLSQVALKSF